jgi:hypothetical protein
LIAQNFNEQETIEAEVAKLMKTPKEFDLAAYATQHTFAELLYACCMYLEWALTPQGTIFGGEALAFCSTSFAQHLRKYFLQLHIRIIDPTKLYVQFNQVKQFFFPCLAQLGFLISSWVRQLSPAMVRRRCTSARPRKSWVA